MTPPVMDNPLKSSVRPSKFNDAESNSIQELLKEQEKLTLEKDNPFSRINALQRLNALPPLSESGEVSSSQVVVPRKTSVSTEKGIPTTASQKSERTRSKSYYSAMNDTANVGSRNEGTLSRSSRPWTQDRGLNRDDSNFAQINDNEYYIQSQASHSSSRTEGKSIKHDIMKFTNHNNIMRERMRQQISRAEMHRPTTQEKQHGQGRDKLRSRSGTVEIQSLDGTDFQKTAKKNRSNGVLITSDKAKTASRDQLARRDTYVKEELSFNADTSCTNCCAPVESHGKHVTSDDWKINHHSSSEKHSSEQRPKSARYGKRPQTSYGTRTVRSDFNKYEGMKYSPTVR